MGSEASVVSTDYASFGFSFPAEDGKQWLDLTGDASNTIEGVEQTERRETVACCSELLAPCSIIGSSFYRISDWTSGLRIMRFS